MSITYTLTGKASSSAGGSLSAQHTEVGASEYTVDQTFAAASSNATLTGAFNYANVQAVYILADQNATLETNSGSSPDNTFSLIAGRPLEWSRSSAYFSNPFTANVTGLFVTCTPATRLQIKILLS